MDQIVNDMHTNTQVQDQNLGLSGLRTQLKTVGLSEEIIQSIIKKAQFELNTEDLNDTDTCFEFALRELMGMISTRMPLFSTAEKKE